MIRHANKLVYCPGVIRDQNNYNKYLLINKAISELEIFYKFKKWPKKNILFVTGSRGKSSVCKMIYYKLKKSKSFKKIFYLDRTNYTFSNIPEFKNGYFLIAEVDYQTLLIAKSIKAQFRIFTSFFKNENMAFKNNSLYLKAKLKIFLDLKKEDRLIMDKKCFKKIKTNVKRYKNKIIFVDNVKSIRKNNNLLCDKIITEIKKNEKH